MEICIETTADFILEFGDPPVLKIPIRTAVMGEQLAWEIQVKRENVSGRVKRKSLLFVSSELQNCTINVRQYSTNLAGELIFCKNSKANFALPTFPVFC
jgi:hypothetical protein